MVDVEKIKKEGQKRYLQKQINERLGKISAAATASISNDAGLYVNITRTLPEMEGNLADIRTLLSAIEEIK